MAEVFKSDTRPLVSLKKEVSMSWVVKFCTWYCSGIVALCFVCLRSFYFSFFL